MERVTENYLEGEQRICDVWARYINSRNMTIEEAAAYIRDSHVLANTSAHLIFKDTLTGLSTRPKQGTTDDYGASYERVGLLDHMEWEEEIGLTDDAVFQVRQAVYGVATGTMTIDEAIAAYGSFAQ